MQGLFNNNDDDDDDDDNDDDDDDDDDNKNNNTNNNTTTTNNNNQRSKNHGKFESCFLTLNSLRWLDIRQVLFCICVDQDKVQVNKR